MVTYGKTMADRVSWGAVSCPFYRKWPPGAYRRKVQHYANEKGSVWEDVRYGLVYGSEAFLNDLKNRFLSDRKNIELPQHNRMYRDADPDRILKIASGAMQIDLGDIRKSKRIPKHQRDQRDLLVYLLWETGRFSNHEIGSLLSMSYSNVSRRIKLKFPF